MQTHIQRRTPDRNTLYTNAFRRYLVRFRHDDLPKPLRGIFAYYENQRTRLGYIRAYTETTHPRFRYFLAQYINYLSFIHFQRMPKRLICDTTRLEALRFSLPIINRLRTVNALSGNAPNACRGQAPSTIILLNVDAYRSDKFEDLWQAIQPMLLEVPGSILIIHAYVEPERRYPSYLDSFRTCRPDYWITIDTASHFAVYTLPDCRHAHARAPAIDLVTLRTRGPSPPLGTGTTTDTDPSISCLLSHISCLNIVPLY